MKTDRIKGTSFLTELGEVRAAFMASHGGAWPKMTVCEKRKDWANMMVLRESIGKKLYSNPFNRKVQIR